MWALFWRRPLCYWRQPCRRLRSKRQPFPGLHSSHHNNEQEFKSARSVIIHYPLAGAEGGALAGLRGGLPARHLAKDITLFQVIKPDQQTYSR